jgi:mono/diheme cytochrome c family protein
VFTHTIGSVYYRWHHNGGFGYMFKRAFWVLTIVCAIIVSGAAQSASPAKPAGGDIARGKYLSNNIAMCGDCHTPTDKKGNPIKGRTLQGAALTFKSLVDVPDWMPVAPGIAGLSWTDEQAIRFFMTGKRPNGTMAAPPMPPFRLTKADAAAITAYLKSLKP